MRVFLTGASGFLGSHLAKVLLARGVEVLAYRRSASNLQRLAVEQETIFWFDSGRSLEAPFEGPAIDVVIHTAASYGREGEANSGLLRSNVLFSLELHELASAHRVPLFLNIHTALDRGVSPYSRSKHQAAEWMDLSESLPKTLHLKLEHFYGPGDDSKKFLGWVLQQCQSNVERIELTEGRQRRDFFHIKDAVSAILQVMDHQDRLEHRQQIQIGSGESYPIRKVVEKIHSLSGSSSTLVFGAKTLRAGEPMELRADLETMRTLGWQPTIALEEGLKEICLSQNKQRT